MVAFEDIMSKLSPMDQKFVEDFTTSMEHEINIHLDALRQERLYSSRSRSKRFEKQQRSIAIVSQWLNSHNPWTDEENQKEKVRKYQECLSQPQGKCSQGKSSNFSRSKETCSRNAKPAEKPQTSKITCDKNFEKDILDILQKFNYGIKQMSLSKEVETGTCANEEYNNNKSSPNNHQEEATQSQTEKSEIEHVSSPNEITLDQEAASIETMNFLEQNVNYEPEHIDFVFGDSSWKSKNLDKTMLIEILKSSTKDDQVLKSFKENQHQDFGGQGHTNSTMFLSNKETIYLNCFLFSRNYKLQPWMGVTNQQPWKGVIASMLIKEYPPDASCPIKPLPHRDKHLNSQKRMNTNLLSFGEYFTVSKTQLQQRVFETSVQHKIILKLTETATRTQGIMNLSYMDFSILRQLQTFIWRPGDLLQLSTYIHGAAAQHTYSLTRARSKNGFGQPILEDKTTPSAWPASNLSKLERPIPAPPWIIKITFLWCYIVQRLTPIITQTDDTFLCLNFVLLSLFLLLSLIINLNVYSLFQNFIWKPGDIFGILDKINEFQGSTLMHSSTKPGSFNLNSSKFVFDSSPPSLPTNFA